MRERARERKAYFRKSENGIKRGVCLNLAFLSWGYFRGFVCIFEISLRRGGMERIMVRDGERGDAMLAMLLVIFECGQRATAAYLRTSEYVLAWLDGGIFPSRSFYLFIRQTGYLRFFKEL